MQVLLVTLSMLESDADPAPRVAGFIDTLRRQQIDLLGVLRATAGFAQCVVGLDDPAAGTSVRVAPDGRLLTPRSRHDGPRLWLERDPAGPLDALLLRHLLRAVEQHRAARHRGTTAADDTRPGQTTAGPTSSGPTSSGPTSSGPTSSGPTSSGPTSSGPTSSGPTGWGEAGTDEQALVQLLLSATAEDGQRARAALQLGLRADVGLQVVALAGGGTAELVTRVGGRAGALLWAAFDGTDAVLLQGGRLRPDDLVGETTTAGTRELSSPGAAALGWSQASVALRFAAAGLHGTNDDRLVSHEELGALTALATVPGEVARSLPDVRALTELGHRAGGRGLLATLAAVCRTRSHRAAAVQLHLHHSSIAGRLAHAERALGFTLDGDHAITRAQTALLLHHLHARAD